MKVFRDAGGTGAGGSGVQRQKLVILKEESARKFVEKRRAWKSVACCWQ
jgi:hypothetical protein